MRSLRDSATSDEASGRRVPIPNSPLAENALNGWYQSAVYDFAFTNSLRLHDFNALEFFVARPRKAEVFAVT